jgi:hypothetical protein
VVFCHNRGNGHGQRDFVGVIKLRTLRWRDSPVSSGRTLNAVIYVLMRDEKLQENIFELRKKNYSTIRHSNLS